MKNTTDSTASAAMTTATIAQTVAFLRGPRKQRVVWDLPSERLQAGRGSSEDTPSQGR